MKLLFDRVFDVLFFFSYIESSILHQTIRQIQSIARAPAYALSIFRF